MQCIAEVYERDQLRVSRDGKSQFKMHYRRKRCSRRAQHEDENLCWQHMRVKRSGMYVISFERPHNRI